MTSNPALYLVRRAWEQAGKHRRWMALYFGMFVCAQMIMLCEPYVIGRLLNAVQKATDTRTLVHDVEVGAGLYLAIQLGFWLFHGPARVVERYVAFNIRARYRSEIFRATTELPLQWHRDNHSGETIERMNRAAQSLFEFAQNSFMVINMVLRLVGSELMLLWFMPQAGAVALASTAVAFSLIFAFDKVLYEQYRSLNGFERRIASALHDYVTNMVTVITLRLEARVRKETVRRIESALGIFRSNIVLNEVKWFVTNMLIGVMVALVLVRYAQTEVLAGRTLMGGTFFTLFEYMRRIGDSFYNFASIYGTTVRQAADVRSAESIERARHEVARVSGEEPLAGGWRTAEVRGLGFTYQDEKLRTHHLEDVRIELAKGRSIALVGPSGSGKSTLLTLLRGLHPPERGELYADGVRLEGGLRRLAAVTTLMPQSPEIFADTIRFNITFGLEGDEEELAAAVRLAQFERVLARLPRGLDTDVSEKGVNLSGGERQRLALARGVFFSRDSDVVLLDEPTSSVDPHAEKLIYLGLLRLYKDRSMVSAVHKLHLLPLFDEIYVLDDGRVVERGDFYSLVSQQGPLSALWESYQAAELAAAESAEGMAERVT